VRWEGQNKALGSYHKYSFDLENPIPLSGGETYWFGLHLASDYLEEDDIYWESTDSVFGSKGLWSYLGTFNNWDNPISTFSTAFYLTGEPIEPIPEPTTMLLVGTGIVGLAGLRRKFKK
jgi:hypothetical protein